MRERTRDIDAQRLWRLLRWSGGFTLDDSGASVPHGISVAESSPSGLRFPFDEWCDAEVQAWIACKRRDVGGRRAIGGWFDASTGLVHLDTVELYDGSERDRALAAARRRRQRYAFDLTDGVAIPVMASSGAVA